MNLTIEEIEEIDKTTERIMEIVDQETNWKNRIKRILQSDNYHSKIEPAILNIEGRLRVRISDVIRELADNSFFDGTAHTDEDKEPSLDPHELD